MKPRTDHPSFFPEVEGFFVRTKFITRLRNAFLIFWLPLILISLLAVIATAIGEMWAVARPGIAISQETQRSGTVMALIIFVVVGGIAGWLMGMYLKEHGYGLYADIAIGVLGGVIGGWLFAQIGLITGGLIGSIIAAIIGAVVLIYAIRAAQRAVWQQSSSS